MILSSTGRRYAEAAFDVAQEQNSVQGWITSLRQASQVLERPETLRYFRDPNVPTHEKLQAIDAAFVGVSQEVRNLLRMLTVRNRLGLLPSITTEVERLDREHRGIVEAEVTVARPMTEAEQADVTRRLSASLGKQVNITTSVDPKIIGGILIRIGDRLIDASVAGRFERLRHELAV